MNDDIKHNLFFRERDERWVLSYVPKGGSWKRPAQVSAPKEIRAKAAARAWADEELARIRANGGVHAARRKGGQSLRDVHEDLMGLREEHPDRKTATTKNNWTHLRTHLLGTSEKVKYPPAKIADMPMADAGVPEAIEFVRTIRARVSANHCRNIFSTARMLWDAAQGKGIITTANPFRNQLVVDEVPAQRGVKRKTGDDLDEPVIVPLPALALLAADEKTPLQRRAYYVAAALSGLDDGELAGLQWRFALLPATIPFLAVRQAYALRAEDGVGLQAPKTPNRLRDVPMHPALIAVLEAWRAAWEAFVQRKPKPTDHVFVWTNGKPQRHSQRAALLRRDLARVCAKVANPPLSAEEIGDITFKSFRRTFSSALKHQGVDEEDRGKLMGHAGESVTARNYTLHELERLAALIARIPFKWPASVESSRPSPSGDPEGRDVPTRVGGENGQSPEETRSDPGSPDDGEPFAKPSYVGSNPIRASQQVQVDVQESGARDDTVCGGNGAVSTATSTDDSGDDPPPRRPLAAGWSSARVELPDGSVIATPIAPGEGRDTVIDRLVFGLRQRGVDVARRRAGLQIGGAS